VQYNASIFYNIFGQRYYLSLTDTSGNPITYVPLVGTGPSLQASFTWDPQAGIATATTAVNHNVPLGSLAAVRISGTDDTFDGDVLALSTGATTLTYALLSAPVNPLPESGFVNQDENLLAGLTTSSGAAVGWLVYHAQQQQIEYL
jgi:hypothetical protein